MGAIVRRDRLFATPRQADDATTHRGCPRCGGTKKIGLGIKWLEVDCPFYRAADKPLPTDEGLPTWDSHQRQGGIAPKRKINGEWM